MVGIVKIEKKYDGLPKEEWWYFKFLPALADIIKTNKREPRSWDPLTVYMYSQAERAHFMSLYCGLITQHRAHKCVVWNAVVNQRITREDFPKFYNVVFGCPLRQELVDKTALAFDVGYRMIHGQGKKVETKEKSLAVMDILEYSKMFNRAVRDSVDSSEFEPFGNLQSFSHGMQLSSESESVSLLRRMGFTEI